MAPPHERERQALPLSTLELGPRGLLQAGVIAAVALVSVASATLFDPNGTYVSIAGTNLSTPHPVSNTGANLDCSTSGNPPEVGFDPADGGVLGHFILNQTEATSGLLRADFTTAGLTVPDVQNFASSANVVHWYIITPTADTLLNASTDAVGGRLNLSHVCYQVAVAPTVETELHYDSDHGVITIGSEIALGSSVHDSATVSGPDSLGDPTGDVDFTFYRGGDCETGTPEDAGTDVPLVNGVADPSSVKAALAPGSYAFSAHYDSNNEAVWTDGDSTCEPFTVKKGQLNAATKLHAPDHGVIADGSELHLGAKVHDTAQITGAVDGFVATGAVTFTYSSYEECNTGGSAIDNDGTEAGGDPKSLEVGPPRSR